MPAQQYTGVSDIAAKWRVSDSRVRCWIKEKRIPGCVKIGKTWLVPSGSKRPMPGRPWQFTDLSEEY